MTTENNQAANEAQIRGLIEGRVNAVRARNVDEAMSNIASDIVAFDVVNSLQNVGIEATRKRTETWFASFDEAIGYEMRDLNIVAGEDVAFSHSLNRYSARNKAGVEINMWVRVTVCYRKLEGSWRIMHEHNSVPFDGESGDYSPGVNAGASWGEPTLCNPRALMFKAAFRSRSITRLQQGQT